MMEEDLDPAVMLALNNAHAEETSLLGMAEMTALISMAWRIRGVDRGATALLIALDQCAAYQNPNFAWFKARYTSFVYIDRVIVAGSARGRGIARLFYDDLLSCFSCVHGI